MSEKLLEADFPTTVNLKSILNPTSIPVEDEAVTPQKMSRQQVANWSIELKNRLANNKKLSPEARKAENEIEMTFFNEFFSTFWDPECAKQLMSLGAPLRQALKALGFDVRINPILGFISLKYVKENLIKTKLLNVNTFKAIYNAVANKLVADSEFLTVNNYNIIYCKDLYTKSAKEMLKYLDIQKDVLKPSASSYTVALQDRNKKVFIYFSKIRGLDPKFKNDVNKCAAAIKSLQIDSKKLSVRNATLNSLEQADAIKTAFDPHHADDGLEATSHLNSKSQNNLANKLNKPSEILAAILHLSMTTDSVEAEKALTNDKLRSIPTDRLLKATSWLASSGIMPKGRLKASDADSLVGILLGKL